MINTIGIIGGSGQMGLMFNREFRRLGKEVLTSDIDSIRLEKALVAKSDLVIVSVPIDESSKVVKRISPWLHENQLLSDFCSVKSKVIPSMLETEAAVISAHPMFGSMLDISKQNIILLPVRGKKFQGKYQRLYQDMGLNVVLMDDWKKHDVSMSFIQGLMHFFHIVFTQTLKSKHVDLETLLSICSPVYQANFAFTCRILQRDPHLYTHILMDNPENVVVLRSFIDQAQESLKLIQKKDETTFMENFVSYRNYLGNFGKTFSDQSDFLIDKIKEYPYP
ncbi:MAG: prephenate dehydrogenase/arogenate dehydrogenase family protein [SAR324 cluster bacterium]|nr:prephenate dehydrogenase/arogenate dehydrogenase family protein [SAR324 cluster bacterium]